MVSWVLVNRFRVRRELLTVTVLEVIEAPSSSDEKLVDEEVRESDCGGRLIVGVDNKGTWYTVDLYLYNQHQTFLTVFTTTRQIYHVPVAFFPFADALVPDGDRPCYIIISRSLPQFFFLHSTHSLLVGSMDI